MNKFFSIICNGEFWIAVVFAFIISFVLATIIQDVYDSFKDLESDDEDELEVFDLNLEPVCGCEVYNLLSRDYGIYLCTELGTDNNLYAFMLIARDKGFEVFKCEYESIVCTGK